MRKYQIILLSSKFGSCLFLTFHDDSSSRLKHKLNGLSLNVLVDDVVNKANLVLGLRHDLVLD